MLNIKKCQSIFSLILVTLITSACIGKNVDQLIANANLPTATTMPAAPAATFSWIGASAPGTVTNGWATTNIASVIGTIDGSFSDVWGLAIDNTHGFFYTLDAGNSKLSKFSISTGAFVGAIGYLTSNPNACPTQPNGTTTGWCVGGTFANGKASGVVDGNLGQAKDLTIDPVHDTLYVADNEIGKISKFVLSTGAYVGSVGMIKNTGTVDTQGGAGTAANCPAATGVATPATSWCKGGKFITSDADGGFHQMLTIDIDTSTQNIYIGEYATGRISKLNQNGAFVGAIGSLLSNLGGCPTVGGGNNIAASWCTGGIYQSSSVDGGFTDASIKIDPVHNLMYVYDGSSSRLNKLTLSTGAFVGTIGYLSSNPNSCPTQTDGLTTNGWCIGGTYAPNYWPNWTEKDGAFDGTYSRLAFDTNYLYVTNTNSFRVDKINATTGVYIGSKGNVGWANTGTCTVGVATTWCTDGTFNAGSSRLGMFNYPQAIVMGMDNNLYIADHDNYRIVKMEP